MSVALDDSEQSRLLNVVGRHEMLASGPMLGRPREASRDECPACVVEWLVGSRNEGLVVEVDTVIVSSCPYPDLGGEETDHSCPCGLGVHLRAERVDPGERFEGSG